MNRWSPSKAIVFVCLISFCFAPALLAEPTLDVRPSVCPNLLNRDTRTAFRVALVGDIDFYPTRVDVSTLELTRGDGVGGIATPVPGLRRLPARAIDVAAPAVSGMCSTFGVDGRRDLVILFGQAEVTQALELGSVAVNSTVELCVSGELKFSGQPFSACDTVVVTEFPRMRTPGLDDVDTLPRTQR